MSIQIIIAVRAVAPELGIEIGADIVAARIVFGRALLDGLVMVPVLIGAVCLWIAVPRIVECVDIIARRCALSGGKARAESDGTFVESRLLYAQETNEWCPLRPD